MAMDSKPFMIGLSKSDYQPAFPFDVQCYDERFKDGSDPGSEIDFLVPVVRKLGE